MVVLLYATPVLADTAAPDTTPTVDDISVYGDLLESGDKLYLIYANIPYATNPTTQVSDTYLWQLFNTDNTTELGRTVGYTYQDGGYGYNVYSLYFPATANVTWGTSYLLRLSGNPVVFLTPPVYDFSVATTDYKVIATQALELDILSLADDLYFQWSLTASTTLTEETESGRQLSKAGERVFRGTIYGCQAFAPGIFSSSIQDVAVTDRTWSTAYSDNLTNQFQGTWVQIAKDANTALLGTGYDLVSVIILLAMCFGVVIANLSLGGVLWEGMLDASFLLVWGTRLSFIPMVTLGLIAALCVVYIAVKLKGAWS